MLVVETIAKSRREYFVQKKAIKEICRELKVSRKVVRTGAVVARDRAFAFFKGTCTRGIYDNMKTAVDAIFVGEDRAQNRRPLA